MLVSGKLLVYLKEGFRISRAPVRAFRLKKATKSKHKGREFTTIDNSTRLRLQSALVWSKILKTGFSCRLHHGVIQNQNNTNRFFGQLTNTHTLER